MGENLTEHLLAALEAALLEAKARGLDAYRAWQEARKVLQVPLPPTRYERGGSVYTGRAYVVAVLERDGQEVDRVALRPEAFAEAFADWESLEALVGRLNGLPSEERPPVPFYPWGEEETDRILEVVNRHLETDMEDFRGHYLGALIAVAWKED